MNLLKSHTESAEKKYKEYARLERRLAGIASNPEYRTAAKEDSLATLMKLGLDEATSEKLFEDILQTLHNFRESGEDLVSAEKAVNALFGTIQIGDKNLIQVLDESMTGRAELIYSQVVDWLRGTEGPVLDFGAGDLQVTQLLQDKAGLDIRGVDVRDYRKDTGAQKPVQFDLFDGTSLPFKDKSFSAVLATNVLHHAGETEVEDEETEGNEAALSELCRVAKDKIVLIETVPDPEHVKKDLPSAMERTFWGDTMFNRLFRVKDVPVPGRYETREGWVERLAAHGWKLCKMVDLGYDQPTIRDYHVQYEFIPVNDVETIIESTRAKINK